MNSLLGQPDLARDLAAVVLDERVAQAQADARARHARRAQRLERGERVLGVRAAVSARLVWLPARLGLQRS